MKARVWTSLSLSIAVFFFAFSTLAQESTEPPVLTQFATLDSLVAGVYDGFASLAELKRAGDFGIGTFDRIDGEGIVLDGIVYQVRADGRVYRPDDAVSSPFASVVPFRPTERRALTTALDRDAFEKLLEELEPSPNRMLAVRVRGKFDSVRVRSSYAQKPPYPPLDVALARQPEFQLGAVEGDLVGFRLPPYIKGLNLPGCHFHFLSADRTSGGHLLNFRIESGELEIMEIERFLVVAPPSDSAFFQTDLSVDREKETRRAESSR